MREKLFRGKRTDNSEWAYGSHLFRANDKMQMVCDSDSVPCVPYVIPKTTGQYVGRDDRNGKKIFGGDVVTMFFPYGEIAKALVVFHCGEFGVVWKHGMREHFDVFASMRDVEYEVIGNIHDNPELLEEEK